MSNPFKFIRSKFASLARRIKNRPEVNEQLRTERHQTELEEVGVIGELQQVARLRRASTNVQLFETRFPKCQSGSQSPERKRKHSDDDQMKAFGRKRLKKEDKTAQINEQFEERNGDLQADNEDFPTQNINPKETEVEFGCAGGTCSVLRFPYRK